MKKTTCPISRTEFREKAQVLNVSIGEELFKAAPKEFSTGSLGWNINQKMVVMIGGKPVTVQVGLNVTIVGSKDLPQTPQLAMQETVALNHIQNH